LSNLISKIVSLVPEIEKPKVKLSLTEKLKWTLLVLVLYYILSMVPLYGLHPQQVQRFEALAVLLAAKFGSLLSLGIGPIVTGSIFLQLLVGADIIKVDLKTREGRKKFQEYQTLFTIFFIIFENSIYVLSGALMPAPPTLFNKLLLIFQLILGGFILMLLDEVSSKWGIGSGISLFIVAGVAREIFVSALSPISAGGVSIGIIPRMISAVLGYVPNAPDVIAFGIVSICATILIFYASTYLQSVRVEIPLSFGRVGGFSIKWPLNLLYTSNIPVILTASLIASLEVWGVMLYHAGFPILGSYEVTNVSGVMREVPKSGLVKYLNTPSLVQMVTAPQLDHLISILVYGSLMLIGAIIFSYLWVEIGGQDPETVADQILASGLLIPGFRSAKPVLVGVLRKYIYPLAIMGGLAVGLLATAADILGALSRGTGILLSVMILYSFYQQIIRYHVEELHPSLRKFLKG